VLNLPPNGRAASSGSRRVTRAAKRMGRGHPSPAPRHVLLLGKAASRQRILGVAPRSLQLFGSLALSLGHRAMSPALWRLSIVTSILGGAPPGAPTMQEGRARYSR